KTTISQIKNIPAGDSVGYSRRFVAKNDMIIATVPIGYADGLNRRFGNGNGKMIINGEQAPIIGSVCMDMCMLDISRIKCKEGDPVLVFGEQHPISFLAKYIDTIPYELFTGISRRVKRVYFHE
ncbi:MAG TPA: alanine racemase C-terminal domain-containing protein, partial [Bacteroidia bacterium]|nr:alanine racemase C-terminal domain-containing protein [Bacteroidia bacterium]